jgi:hypothetical protein
VAGMTGPSACNSVIAPSIPTCAATEAASCLNRSSATGTAAAAIDRIRNRAFSSAASIVTAPAPQTAMANHTSPVGSASARTRAATVPTIAMTGSGDAPSLGVARQSISNVGITYASGTTTPLASMAPASTA